MATRAAGPVAHNRQYGNGGNVMRIAKIEDLHCNAGWRDFSFLKITTDDGLVGWSEFMENFGAEGLSTVLQRLGERLIGMDPRPVEKITAFLHGLTRQTPYGINQQAIAAIENALVDIKAKSLNIPVYELLGGPIRDQLRLYWSHCGTWRVSFADRIKDWTGSDPFARRRPERRCRGLAPRLQRPQDKYHAFRHRPAHDPHARLQRARLAGMQHRQASDRCASCRTPR